MIRRVAGSAAAVVALATGCGSDAGSGEVVVFAASSLTEAVETVAAEHYRDGSGIEVVIGGSSGLAAQIRDGAPADLFLSANLSHAESVAAECDPECPVRPFATNSLVLAVPVGNPGSVFDLHDLSRPDLTIVLCAPEVPCGMLADEVTIAGGVQPEVDSYESSVRAVRTRLELGEADAGLIYTTESTGDIEIVPVDELADHVTTYHLVVLDSGPEAAGLADLIMGPTGRELLGDLGFGPVAS